MPGFALVAACILAGTSPQGGLAQGRTAVFSRPIELGLAAQAPTIRPGANLRLTVTVKDISADGIWMQRSYVGGTDIAFGYDVETISGERVPYNLPVPRQLEFAGGPTLHPGQSETEDVGLPRIVLSIPGKYRVRVSRELPKKFGGGTVYSNWVTITVEKP